MSSTREEIKAELNKIDSEVLRTGKVVVKSWISIARSLKNMARRELDQVKAEIKSECKCAPASSAPTSSTSSAS